MPTIVPHDFKIVPRLHRIIVPIGNFSMQLGWRRPQNKRERAQQVEERTGLRHLKLDLSKNRTSNIAKLKTNTHTYTIIPPHVVVPTYALVWLPSDPSNSGSWHE